VRKLVKLLKVKDKSLRIYLASIIVNVLRKRRATVGAQAPKDGRCTGAGLVADDRHHRLVKAVGYAVVGVEGGEAAG
jgi:hypothetical protein